MSWLLTWFKHPSHCHLKYCPDWCPDSITLSYCTFVNCQFIWTNQLNIKKNWKKRNIVPFIGLTYVMVFIGYIPTRPPPTFYFSCLPGPHRAVTLNPTNHSPFTQFVQMVASRADKHMGPWQWAGYTSTGMCGWVPVVRVEQLTCLQIIWEMVVFTS